MHLVFTFVTSVRVWKEPETAAPEWEIAKIVWKLRDLLYGSSLGVRLFRCLQEKTLAT